MSRPAPKSTSAASRLIWRRWGVFNGKTQDRRLSAAALASMCLLGPTASAQIPESPAFRFETGVQVVGLRSGEFDAGDPGLAAGSRSVGDRLLRYPAPVFDDDRLIHQRPFFGHDARVAMGAGLRF